MTRPILPRKIFIVVKDFGDCLGFGGDFTDNLDAAIDQALNHYSDEREPFRIIQLEFDPDTNDFERGDDISDEDIDAVLHQRCVELEPA